MTIETLKSETCIFCGEGEIEVMISRDLIPDKVNVLQCKRCELVFLESRAKDDAFDPEEKIYWENDGQKRIYLNEKVESIFTNEFKKRLSFLQKLIPSPGDLLDVGCGVGHFLKVAREEGWQVKGLDISSAASQAAHERYDLDVKVGTLEDRLFPPASFDVITLWDVIEHIRKPLENLKVANRLLKPGGILVMKTPNEGGLFKQIARVFSKLFGRKGSFLLKYVYYTPHYFSYSRKTMDLLLSETGFKLLEYQLDKTSLEFASQKIDVHYRKDPKRVIVIKLLPLANLLARLLRMENKLIVYAKKVREVSEAGL
ncbi:MAG: class I SAM-dependent methyltransferase [Candidatus Omnitrophica bacterium]|nr:class I SAM-dependent methyltransferase [Candidatus Omnitrophota bacterium]